MISIKAFEIRGNENGKIDINHSLPKLKYLNKDITWQTGLILLNLVESENRKLIWNFIPKKAIFEQKLTFGLQYIITTNTAIFVLSVVENKHTLDWFTSLFEHFYNQ